MPPCPAKRRRSSWQSRKSPARLRTGVSRLPSGAACEHGEQQISRSGLQRWPISASGPAQGPQTPVDGSGSSRGRLPISGSPSGGCLRGAVIGCRAILEKEKEVMRRQEVSVPRLSCASGCPLSAAAQGGTDESSATGPRLKEPAEGKRRRRAVVITAGRDSRPGARRSEEVLRHGQLSRQGPAAERDARDRAQRE